MRTTKNFLPPQRNFHSSHKFFSRQAPTSLLHFHDDNISVKDRLEVKRWEVKNLGIWEGKKQENLKINCFDLEEIQLTLSNEIVNFETTETF